MRKYPIHVSKTGASSAEFIIVPTTGKPIINLTIPVGGGRRMRIEMAIGSARAAAEVLALALADVEHALGPYDNETARGRR